MTYARGNKRRHQEQTTGNKGALSLRTHFILAIPRDERYDEQNKGMRETNMLNVIIGIGGTVAGTVLGAFITYRFALRLNSNIEFNKAAAVFRAAFVEVMYWLRQGSEVEGRMIPQILTDAVLVDQEKAKLVFEPFLSKTELAGFNAAWDEYIGCRINYGGKTSSRSEERQYCLGHIDRLLSYAAPK